MMWFQTVKTFWSPWFIQKIWQRCKVYIDLLWCRYMLCWICGPCAQSWVCLHIQLCQRWWAVGVCHWLEFVIGEYDWCSLVSQSLEPIPGRHVQRYYTKVSDYLSISDYFAWVCVLFRGTRGTVCEKRLTFLYTSPYEHVEYNVWGLRLSAFVFKKCSEKMHSRLNIVIRA